MVSIADQTVWEERRYEPPPPVQLVGDERCQELPLSPPAQLVGKERCHEPPPPVQLVGEERCHKPPSPCTAGRGGEMSGIPPSPLYSWYGRCNRVR